MWDDSNAPKISRARLRNLFAVMGWRPELLTIHASAALKGQDDNSSGQARHERRPGKTATARTSLFLFCPEDLRANRKREVFIFGPVTPGGAALARGNYHNVLTGLRGTHHLVVFVFENVAVPLKSGRRQTLSNLARSRLAADHK